MGVALAEITLNAKGQYIGNTFTKQDYYQFAAKAHEITMQASLSVMFLSFIRSRLTSKDGLSFGAFLGGLQFLQLSYLWSIELWSSISFHRSKLWKSLVFLTGVTVFATLAATAGPSSATLLIPRQSQRPQSSQWLSINGSSQDIWPDHLDSKNIPEQCASLPMLVPNPQCPSTDWFAIQQILITTQGLFTLWDGETDDAFILGIPDPTYQFQKMLAVAVCPSNPRRDQFCASSQQTFLSGINTDLFTWYQNEPSSLTFHDAVREIEKNYWEPYLVASCVADTINSTNDQDFLRFARISETEDDFKNDRLVLPVPGLQKRDSMSILGNRSDHRVKWVELPQNLFPGKPLGTVILHPNNFSNGSEQNVTTCTIAAGWGTSTIMTDFIRFSNFFSTITNTPTSSQAVKNLDGLEEYWSEPDYTNTSDFVYPQRRITISETWAEFLNPAVIGTEGNTTVINSLLSIVPTPPDETYIAAILSILVASGLSWSGGQLDWKRNFNPLL